MQISIAQNKRIDSLQNILQKADNKELRAPIHLKLSHYYLHQNPEKALYHAHQGKQLAKEIHNDSLIFDAYSKISDGHFIMTDYKNAISYMDSALVYKKKIPKTMLLRMYDRLGIAYFSLEKYQNAISVFNEQLIICDENNLELRKINVLQSLGNIYIKEKDWKKAEKYVNDAIQIANKHNNQKYITSSYLYLGKMYLGKQEYIKAGNILEKARKNAIEQKAHIILHTINNNLGKLYSETGAYNKAMLYHKNNLEIDKKYNNTTGLSQDYFAISGLLIKQNKLNEAAVYIKKSLQNSIDINDYLALQSKYLKLSEIYESLGDLKKTLVYRKLYEEQKDLILNKNHLDAISELEIKYKTQRKENKILELSYNDAKNKMALKANSTTIKFLVSGLITLLIMFAMLFIIVRQQSKNKKQKELFDVISETQIDERNRIAKDLHDSVGSSLALLKIKLLDKSLTTDINTKGIISDSLKILDQSTYELREIAHNMMPEELLKFGLVAAIQAILDKLHQRPLETYLYVHNMNNRIENTKELHLYRIVQEIIQNVLKHAKAKQLIMYINKHNKYLSVIVEDDGVGFDTTKVLRGMGLTNIQTRIKYLKGKVHIDSNENTGTTVNIEVPL